MLARHRLFVRLPLTMAAALTCACVEGEPDLAAPSQAPCADCTGCQGWRNASCAFATRCGAASTQCAAQYATIQCRSETRAEICAHQLHAAYCDDVPPDCGAKQIADNTAAFAGCQQFRQASCASAVECGYAVNLDECLAKPALDCADAVALSASFSQCLSELPDVDCQVWLPPDACVGAIVTSVQ